MSGLPLPLLLIASLAALHLGCAGSWSRARREDSAAAYHRFLREHPGSSRADEARERLAFARLRSRPSDEAYAAFLAEHPGSPLLAELRPVVEEIRFEKARRAGTAQAYRGFLSEFPDGAHAATALGNATYLESQGFGLDAPRLAGFAAQHPASDFAAEARRSAAALRERAESGIRRLRVEIQVDPSSAEADRLGRVFLERARQAYAGSGIELAEAGAGLAAPGGEPKALLRIEHREEVARGEVQAGQVARPGLVARTRVRVTQDGGEGSGARTLWEREFALRGEAAQLRANESPLFAPGAQRYWEEFFVPRVTWSTAASVREAVPLAGRVAAVATAGSLAVVLLESGSFRLFSLADPAQPALLAAYDRPADHTSWSGVHLAGPRIALYGADGLEVVELGAAGGAQRVARLGRDRVGSIAAAESVGDHLVAAGRLGLFRVDAETGAAARLVDRPILGLARLDDRLLFSDGTSLFAASIAQLSEQRVEAELRLGRGFAPGRLHVHGQSVLVLGETGVVRVDLSRPAEPRVVSRIESREAGAIGDAAAVGDRLFLLGERGLQVLDASGERVVDSADVTARRRMTTMGRHLVLVGGDSLQVVDALPLVGDVSPALSAR